jgi:hypothetical protein
MNTFKKNEGSNFRTVAKNIMLLISGVIKSLANRKSASVGKIC